MFLWGLSFWASSLHIYWLHSFTRKTLIDLFSNGVHWLTIPSSVSASSSSPLTSWPWPRRRWWWCTRCPESMKSGKTFVPFTHNPETMCLHSSMSLLISWFLYLPLCVSQCGGGHRPQSSIFPPGWERHVHPDGPAGHRAGQIDPCWIFSPETRESIGTPAFALPLFLKLWIPLL